jgi:hypothetical protein
MRNQSKTPQFTCGHPLLDAATEQLAAFLEAAGELARTKDWLTRNAEELVPTKWTKSIEAAVGKDDELESLRVQHSEKSLTLANVVLTEAIAREVVWERHRALSATLEQLVAEHDKLKDSRKPIVRMLQSAVVTIDQAMRDADLTLADAARGLDTRGFKAMRDAAKVVAEVAKRGHYHVTDLVVPGRKYLAYLNQSVDLRNCYPVAIREKADRWTKAAALYNALLALENSLKQVRDASSDLRSDANGSVNESQHASRLVSQLYGEGCGGLNEKVIDEQNARRIAYNARLARFAVLVEQFAELRIAATKALAEAVAEAETNGSLDDTPRMATTQSVIDDERRAVNNIVAADVMLRRFARELKEHEQTAREDYSRGNGAVATNDAFERIAQFKRPKKDGQSKSA